MTWLVILFLVWTCTSSQADTRSTLPPVSCKDNQHCSNCDGAGNCLECTPGYFGRTCGALCSENCFNKKCTESKNGNVNCTDGCIPGYQGTGCSMPCHSPAGGCTLCPGGCDGGYCQLGSSCVSGCVDSYYGTGCTSCSSQCKVCNRSTGGCIECHQEGDCENDPQETGGPTSSVLTGLLVSLLLLVSGIFVTLCLLYYRRLPKHREQVEQREDMHQDEVEYLDYLPSVQGDIVNTNRHSNHAYHDVVNADTHPAIVFL